MPQYEVTTTATITRTYILDADGVETAKEQAQALSYESINGRIADTKLFEVRLHHEIEEMILPSEDAKQYI
jgi:hypothetical protein